jgi:hypothetical protein
MSSRPDDQRYRGPLPGFSTEVTGWSGGQKTTWGTVLRRRPFAGFGFEGKFGLVSGADGDVLG